MTCGGGNGCCAKISDGGEGGTSVSKAKIRSKGPAVICDFDDTTVLENVAEMLLKEFGGEGWRKYQRQNVQHRMTLKEYQERAFQTVKVGREAMKDHVKERATLRPHFKALYEHCRKNNIPLAIATMGLDFYVEALLEREGMESVESYAAETEFTDEGIRYEYPYASKDCWQPGNCKCAVLERYRKKGHSVILFAGDGKTDICPADRSDIVFARRYLEEHRMEKGLPFVQLDDFSKMVRVLEKLTADSRASDSEAAKDD
jgi:2,3-diketo-5-methylthio-1-phosphopentane phosphatase